MINIVYTDGIVDEFKSTKYLSIDMDSDDEWAIITENTYDSDADDYDSDEDVTIAQIRKDHIRKIQFG